MKTIETKVYNFDELSDDAKEKARQWCRENDDFSFHAESVLEDAKECAKLIGIDIDNIYYSGFSSQGDGACFEGAYSYKAGGLKAIKEHAPKDKELHRIAKALQDAQKAQFYNIHARVKQSGHYSHSGCTNIDVYHNDRPYDSIKQEDAIKEALRDFMDWIYKQLEKEYEYHSEDAQVDESINANEYTFTETGKRFG